MSLSVGLLQMGLYLRIRSQRMWVWLEGTRHRQVYGFPGCKWVRSLRPLLGSIQDSTISKVAVTYPTLLTVPRTLAAASLPGLYLQRVTGVSSLRSLESRGSASMMMIALASVRRWMNPRGMMWGIAIGAPLLWNVKGTGKRLSLGSLAV